MRSVAAFASLLALGLLAGGVLVMLASPPTNSATPASGVAGPGGLEFRSLLIGLLIGLILSNLTRVPWADLPRRAVVWVVDHETNLYRGALALLFVGILIFY